MSSLHDVLLRTDGTHEGITRSAAEMMRRYDRSAGTAVTEWRNALQACQTHQLLPLLYVANEVLQNSKRNRGNKFLEAFAPILGQALQHICQRQADLVEKVRRTTKIWGDRRVFSVRFVTELLKGLEQYRNGSGPAPPPPPPQEEQGFSPENHPPAPQSQSPEPSAEVTTSPSADDLMMKSDDDDQDMGGEGDDDDDDDSMGFNNEGQLDVAIDADALLTADANRDKPKLAAGAKSSSSSMKRRRSSASGGKRRRSVLSTQSLQDLWNQLSSLQQAYDQSQTALQAIPQEYLTEEGVQDLVGEELLDAYKRVLQYQKMLTITEKRNLHRIANSKHSLEVEAMRYLPWIQSTLEQDEEDIEFCNKMEEELKKYQLVHSVAKQARDKRRQKEAIAKAKEEEERRKRQEIADREAMLQQALTKQDEAKPGMVWNKALQEYVYLNTDEGWRD